MTGETAVDEDVGYVLGELSKSVEDDSNLPSWMAGRCDFLLAILRAEDIVVFTKEVLRHQCISHRQQT